MAREKSWMARTPEWAMELAQKVVDRERTEGMRAPLLCWFKTPGRMGSSGRYWADIRMVVISAGMDEMAQRITLLHELAHWKQAGGRTSFPKRFRWHSVEFFKLMFRLCEEHGADMKEAIISEAKYKKVAMTAAKQMGYEIPRNARAFWASVDVISAQKKTLSEFMAEVYGLDREGREMGLPAWVIATKIDEPDGSESQGFGVLLPQKEDPQYFEVVAVCHTAEEVRDFFKRELALSGAREAVAA